MGREEDCRRLAEEAIAVMGGVDMLILNAAIHQNLFSSMKQMTGWVGICDRIYENQKFLLFINLLFSCFYSIFLRTIRMCRV